MEAKTPPEMPTMIPSTMKGIFTNRSVAPTNLRIRMRSLRENIVSLIVLDTNTVVPIKIAIEIKATTESIP